MAWRWRWATIRWLHIVPIQSSYQSSSSHSRGGRSRHLFPSPPLPWYQDCLHTMDILSLQILYDAWNLTYKPPYLRDLMKNVQHAVHISAKELTYYYLLILEATELTVSIMSVSNALSYKTGWRCLYCTHRLSLSALMFSYALWKFTTPAVEKLLIWQPVTHVCWVASDTPHATLRGTYLWRTER